MEVAAYSIDNTGRSVLDCKHTDCKFKANDEFQHISDGVDKKSLLKPYICSICGWNFKRPDNLKTHEKKIHLKQLKIADPAPDGKEIESDKVPQIKHTKKTGAINSSAPELSTVKSRPLKCEICGQAFRERKRLDLHQIRVHGKEKLVCIYEGCTTEYANQESMKRHVRVKHNLDPLPHKCTKCDKAFKFKKGLTVHTNAHMKLRPFMCEICSKTFTDIRYLRQHQTLHPELNLEPIKCKECNKMFTSATYRREHYKLQHEKIFNYKCDLCDFKSNKPSAIKIHNHVVHLKEKIEECEHCQQRFVTKEKLKIHIRRVHTRERPYKCKICSKDFLGSTEWKRHEQIHENNLKHVCEFCGKKFPIKDCLRQHLRSHNKKKNDVKI